MRLVALEPHGIPGGMRGRWLWYDDVASATGELSTYEHSLVFRAAPHATVRVVSVVLVNVHGPRVLPIVRLDARRAPWTPDGGGVQWDACESSLVPTGTIAATVESLGGIVHARPAMHYAFRDVSHVHVSPQAPLALRASYLSREDVPESGESLYLSAVYVVEVV